MFFLYHFCSAMTASEISAPESLGQGNGGYHTEKRAMKLIGRVAGESVGWSGRQLIVNDICRGLRVPHTSALTHTKTRENWRPTVVVVRLPAYSQWGGGAYEWPGVDGYAAGRREVYVR